MLSTKQLSQAKEFYGSSIEFSKVIIKNSPFVSNSRPWTCGNVIRVSKALPDSTPSIENASLIHELCHVWQHQHGQPVFLTAAAEQVLAILYRRFDPYDFGGPSRLARPCRLSNFLPESQAQILAEYWKSQHGFKRDRLDNPFSKEYVENLRRLVQETRISLAVPVRASTASRIDSAVCQVVNTVLGIFE
jgi:hypothetical protein